MIGALKLLSPKVIKAILKYVFEDNELDVIVKQLKVQIRDLEQKCTDIGFKSTAMQGVIKELDANSHTEKPFDDRISKLEDFAKQVRNKKVFKSLNAK